MTVCLYENATKALGIHQSKTKKKTKNTNPSMHHELKNKANRIGKGTAHRTGKRSSDPHKPNNPPDPCKTPDQNDPDVPAALPQQTSHKGRKQDRLRLK